MDFEQFLDKRVSVIHNGIRDYITGTVIDIESDFDTAGRGRILLLIDDMGENDNDDYIWLGDECWIYNIHDPDFDIIPK